MDEQNNPNSASDLPNGASDPSAENSPSQETAATEVTPTINFGEYLRQAREAQSLSLKQISQKTKINTTQLDFLENGEITKLPNKAYVIGYVKSYAKTIGLDLEYCLRLLEDAYRPLNPPPPTTASGPTNAATTFPLKNVLAGVALVVGLVIIILIAKNLPSKKATSVAVATPTPQFATLTESAVATVTPLVAATETATVTATAEPTMTAQLTKGAVNNALLYRLGPSDSSEVKQIPENIRQAYVAGKQNIFIMAADGDSWITYKKDNDPIRKLMLKQHENLRLVGDDIRIFAGNVTAIKIFLNNRPVEFQSSTGLKSFIFPQENIKRYKLPLFIFKEDGSV
ncbi:MAG: helix-turn-helix domain-containing protein, partial [Bacteriovoracaceae bacterium]|nr:helix-turn-helix domain-containing protein [Bacteriovoracaceae bacterium]